jgi:hypothetical protein
MDPGETVDLTATLINMGGAPLSNLSTTLSAEDPRVNIVDNSGAFGAMAVDEIKENTSDPYVVAVSPTAPQGHVVSFRLIATDAGFADTIDFDLNIGMSAPSDTGRYYVFYSGGPHLESPSFDWIAIDTTQSTYPGTSLNFYDNQSVTVSLPFTFTYYGNNYSQITVCSNGWVAMGSTTSADWTNSGIPNVDGPDAMIAGLWDDLDPGNSGMAGDVYTYYDAPNNRFIIEYFRVEHYPSGYEENFEIILLDPAYYTTPTGDGEIIVQYLNAMQQDDNTVGIETPDQFFGIQYFRDAVYHPLAAEITDGFALRYTTFKPGQTGVDEYIASKEAKQPISLQVNPNPFSNLIQIRYSILDTRYSIENPTLNIFDASGRLVKSYNLESSIQNQESSVVWDGCDDLGRRLPNGIYFARLDAQDASGTAKIILVD